MLRVIDIFSKYAWVVPFKEKIGATITDTFQKMFEESWRKPNKIWVDKGSRFYNKSLKSLLEKNDVEMYSNHNASKSLLAERFIKTLENKIYKYVTSISKNVYIDELADMNWLKNTTIHIIELLKWSLLL